MITYNELENRYNTEKQRMDNGEVINKLELMFIGYALDAVDTGKHNFKINLDFSEDSIKNVELILDKLNKSLYKAPSKEIIMSFAKQFAGYIGQIIINKWGGEWIDESNYEIENGPGLKVKDQHLFLLSKVYRRITRGSEENVYHFYETIKKDFDGDYKEVNVESLYKDKNKSFIKRIFGIKR